MALYILLNNDGIDVNDFKNKIQGLSPYWHNDVSLINSGNIDLSDLIMTDINIPEIFVQSAKISEDVFSSYVKNQKSNKIVPIYYTFYSTLYDYVYSPTEANYIILRDLLLGVENTKIEKAFGVKKIALLLAFSLTSYIGFADDNLYREAREFQRGGKYDEAIDAYKTYLIQPAN